MTQSEFDYETAMLVSNLFYNVPAEKIQNLKAGMPPERKEILERYLKIANGGKNN